MRDNPKGKSRMDNPEKLKHWAHKMKTDKTKKNTAQYVLDTTLCKRT